MKRLLIEIIIIIGAMYWMISHGWVYSALVFSAVWFLILGYGHYFLSKELVAAAKDRNQYARAYHATQMLLGNIRYRIQNAEHVDVDELITIANEKMDGAKKINAYHFLEFDDGTKLPYWEPSDSERGKHILATLRNAARATDSMPDGDIYSNSIMEVYWKISSELGER